jgi:GNAT superfamily N-acetyltransferase
MSEGDLATADRIVRLAFGTFIGLSEPEKFMGDGEYVRTRWRANPSGAFVAEFEGEVVGSNFASNWGSFGFFGPLTIRPDLWDRGIGQKLVEPVIDCFDRWNMAYTGLYTFAHSPKHISLYQRFGFWPRFLTSIMSKPVEPNSRETGWKTLSEISHLGDFRVLTDSIYSGLDVTNEIRSVADQKLGDTVVLEDNSRLAGFSVCHSGPGSEAGSGNCYIKFAAAADSRSFQRLLAACEHMAAEKKLQRITAGVNTSRIEAYRLMLEHGYRTDTQGVAMHRPNESGFSRSGVYIIDDWR